MTTNGGRTASAEPVRNEAAERLRELVLAVARDEPVEIYESPDELSNLFGKALAAERRATRSDLIDLLRLRIGSIQVEPTDTFLTHHRKVLAILDEEAAR